MARDDRKQPSDSSRSAGDFAVSRDRLLNGDAFRDRLPASVQLPGTLEPNRSDQSPCAAKEGEKSIVFDSTKTDLHFISVSDLAGDRDTKIELIRPDIGNRRMTLCVAMNDSFRQDLGLLDCTRPMFKSGTFGIVRILPARAVAQSKNAWPPREPRRIADNTIINFEPRPLQPLRRRSRTDTHDDDVRRQSRSIRQSDRGDPPCSIKSFDADIEMESHALLAMPRGNTLAQHRTKASNQWRRKWINDGHLETLRATARRDFHSDEPSTHDNDTFRLLDFRAKRVGIGQCPKTDHAGKILTKGQLSSVSSGCQDDRVGGFEPIPTAERQTKCIGVEGHRLTAELPDDIEIAHLAASKREFFVHPIAGQKLLGERRPVIGPLGLTTNDRDSTGIAFTSKRLHDSQSRKRCTDDDKMIVHELKFLD